MFDKMDKCGIILRVEKGSNEEKMKKIGKGKEEIIKDYKLSRK